MIGLNLIAFLYRLTTTLIYAFVETIDLYIVGFWKKTNKQKKSVYVAALFPMMLRCYDEEVVCILLHLNVSRHFNMCLKHCQKTKQLICQRKQSYVEFVLLESWQKAVCVFFLFF